MFNRIENTILLIKKKEEILVKLHASLKNFFAREKQIMS